MKNQKRKIEIYPLRPIKSIWDGWAALILGSGFGIVLFSFIFLGLNSYVLAASVLIGFVGFVFCKSQNATPEERQRYFWFYIPIALGITTTILQSWNMEPLIIGGGITGFAILWLSVLRHPPQFLAASKAFQADAPLRALHLLNRALNVQSTHWESYQLRAVIHLSLFRYLDAESDARKALRLKPENYMCHNTLGLILLAQQRYQESRQSLSQALVLAPQYAINHFNKAVVCYRLGEFSEAIKLLRFALKHDLREESYMLGCYYLGCSLTQIGDADNAQSAYKVIGKYKATYEKIIARHQDAPDYPNVVMMRHELEDIKERFI